MLSFLSEIFHCTDVFLVRTEYLCCVYGYVSNDFVTLSRLQYEFTVFRVLIIKTFFFLICGCLLAVCKNLCLVCLHESSTAKLCYTLSPPYCSCMQEEKHT